MHEFLQHEITINDTPKMAAGQVITSPYLFLRLQLCFIIQTKTAFEFYHMFLSKNGKQIKRF